MYWYEDGHPNDGADVSAQSRPENPAQLEAVKEFIKEVSWENEPIGKLMALSDGLSREKFHQHTQKLRQDGLLKHLDQGPHAVNSSLVAIVNMAAQPRRDPKDAQDGWTSTNAWGNYEGAWAVFPDLGIMIEQEPGDIMLCRSHYLEHWITEITSGERYCCTRMTKENVINLPERRVRCPVPHCDWLSGSVSSLRYHVQTKHFSLTDTEVQSIMATIHTDFPEYSTKDIKTIAANFRARLAGPENKEAKNKAKMAAIQGAQHTNSGDLEEGLSKDDDTEADRPKEET